MKKSRKVAWVVLGVVVVAATTIVALAWPSVLGAYYMWRAEKLPDKSPPAPRESGRCAANFYPMGDCTVLDFGRIRLLVPGTRYEGYSMLQIPIQGDSSFNIWTGSRGLAYGYEYVDGKGAGAIEFFSETGKAVGKLEYEFRDAKFMIDDRALEVAGPRKIVLLSKQGRVLALRTLE